MRKFKTVVWVAYLISWVLSFIISLVLFIRITSDGQLNDHVDKETFFEISGESPLSNTRFVFYVAFNADDLTADYVDGKYVGGEGYTYPGEYSGFVKNGLRILMLCINIIMLVLLFAKDANKLWAMFVALIGIAIIFLRFDFYWFLLNNLV